MWENLRRIFARDQNPKLSASPLDFRDLPPVDGRYTMHIAGEQFDGRQSIIRSLSVGQCLILQREPDNPFDHNAVAVETTNAQMIGYLSRHNASWVSRIMDEGVDLSASVACVFYGDADGKGIEVQINIDGVPPLD